MDSSPATKSDLEALKSDVNSRFSQVDNRIGSLESRVDSLESTMNRRFDQVVALITNIEVLLTEKLLNHDKRIKTLEEKSSRS